MGEPDRENRLGAGELRARLDAREDHVRELYDELAQARLVADEASAAREAREARVEELEDERDNLAERVREMEGEGRWRLRRRGQHERRLERLEREVGRLEGEVERRDQMLRRSDEGLREARSEAKNNLRRGEETREELRRRLEERDEEVSELRGTIDALEGQLDEEYEARRSLAGAQNRLRAGIEVFNGSEQLRVVNSISKSFGRPEVLAALEDGQEPPVALTFVWRDMTWQTYHANPGLEVEEPRVYLHGSGDDLPEGYGSPNAHIEPGGRVSLGL